MAMVDWRNESATISQVVSTLTELIERSPLPRSETQQKAIAHLKTIPDYVTRKRLDEWETNFPWESVEGESSGSTIASLLEAVFELARYNLYTQFDSKGTMSEYATVSAKLLAAGLSPPQIKNITDW